VVAYWNALCHGCPEMHSGSLQCVMFVLGAYALAGQPLHVWGNAIDFWSLYQHQPGWQEVPVGRGIPQPGDILIWQGGQFGHAAVVINVVAPENGQDGSVTVAQANAPSNRFPGSGQPGNWYSMPLHPDLELGTWLGYRVLGALQPAQDATGVPDTLPAGLSWQTPYVQMAWDDALQAGIAPAIFVRQINQESGFHPDARSSAGAEGIAQFLPGTAANLGINPWNPASALAGAARYMAREVQAYQGDYARALAAYNAGAGAVDACVRLRQAGWLTCMPAETQQYVNAILH
jgi:surface antigen